MELTTGFNHLAIVTADVRRLADFYADVFDAEVTDVPVQPGASAGALVRLGTNAALALVEVPDSPSTEGGGDELRRGHLDHVGFEVPTAAALEQVRQRLVARGVSDGVVHDYGDLVTVGFVDPDGMSTEACWLRDPALTDLRPPTSSQGPVVA
jgi:catechol 2,3-dioxygenase-like lactoylglutathione lyase family enzyme